MIRTALCLLAALPLLHGQAHAQSLEVGQFVVADITADDPRLEDGTSHDCWVFPSGPAGGTYTVRVASHLFDPVVDVGPGRDCTAQIHDGNDDDPDGGSNSHLQFAADGGPWFVRVSTVDPGETGQYRLNLEAGGTPGFGGYAGMMSDDGEYAYLVARLCAAVDLTVRPDLVVGRTAGERAADAADSARLTRAAVEAGAVLGKSEAQVTAEIAADARDISRDGSSFGAPLAEVRAECRADLDGVPAY